MIVQFSLSLSLSFDQMADVVFDTKTRSDEKLVTEGKSESLACKMKNMDLGTTTTPIDMSKKNDLTKQMQDFRDAIYQFSGVKLTYDNTQKEYMNFCEKMTAVYETLLREQIISGRNLGLILQKLFQASSNRLLMAQLIAVKMKDSLYVPPESWYKYWECITKALELYDRQVPLDTEKLISIFNGKPS